MYRVSLDSLQKLAQIVAVGVGGLWVYVNSVRGRLFVARLQLTLSGRVLSDGGKRYVLVTMQTKNVGQTLVDIDADATMLKLTPLRARQVVSDVEDLMRDNQRMRWFEVLDKIIFKTKGNSIEPRREKIKFIEPGVAVDEQKLIEVPSSGDDAFALEFKVGGFPGGWWGGFKRRQKRVTIFTTMAVAVTNASSKEHNKPS
jgi:hypothetical protein